MMFKTMFKHIKNQQGLTLVELIISMIIISVIFTSVAAVLSSTVEMYSKLNEWAEINSMLDNISGEMVTDAREANRDVTISDKTIMIRTKNKGDVIYNVENGFLYKNGQLVLDKLYYKGKTIDMNFLDEDGNTIDSGSPAAFTIKITLLPNGDFSREYSIKPLGLNKY